MTYFLRKHLSFNDCVTVLELCILHAFPAHCVYLMCNLISLALEKESALPSLCTQKISDCINL